MAHSPETKAKVVTEIILGTPYQQISERHNVGKATSSEWAAELRAEQNRTETERSGSDLPVTTEARKQRFNTALDEFLMATLTMLNAWAETCSDPSFIRTNPQGVNELGATVLDRADRLVSSIRRE